jgi:phospholipase/lecithinase/hemolysin
MGAKIDEFLASNAPDGNELFVVFGGDNDLILHGQTDVTIPVSNLVNHISTLASAGAKHFIVPNQPPLGKWPGVSSPSRRRTLNAITEEFNDLLSVELSPLDDELKVDIYDIDLFGLTQSVISDGRNRSPAIPRASIRGC